MTLNANTLFGGRILAALFAVLLSTAMVVGSVGPAFNVQPAGQTSDYLA